MNINTISLAHVSDDQLLVRVKELVRKERAVTRELLVHLAEMELRRLHCREGCSSLFTYCVEVLHLSEPAAYRRIKAARLAKRFPIVLDMLAEGSIHLAALDVLAAHLTDANHLELLAEARHQSKRQVEGMAARLRPLPDVAPMVRKLPGPHRAEVDRTASPVSGGPITNSILETSAGEGTEPGSRRKQELGTGPGAELQATAQAPVEPRPENGGPTPSPSPSSIPDPNPGPRPMVAPLSPARYRIQFTANAYTYRKLRQVQELLRHQVPDGDPSVIVDTALTLLLEKLLREKTGAVTRPRRRETSRQESGEGQGKQATPGTGKARQPRVAAGKPSESRRIPAEVKRAVWQRDRGRCAFTAKNGRRCSERGTLEFHHVEPYMLGGKATVENISLRCRAHNAYEGALIFGDRRPGIPGKKTPELSPGRVGTRGERRTDTRATRGSP